MAVSLIREKIELQYECSTGFLKNRTQITTEKIIAETKFRDWKYTMTYPYNQR